MDASPRAAVHYALAVYREADFGAVLRLLA